MLICVLVLRVAPSWAARWLGCRRRGRCCCAPSGTRRPSWTPSDSRLSSTRAPWSRRGRGATWSWETCTLSYSIRSALFELLHVEAVVHFFMVSYWYVCVCVGSGLSWRRADPEAAGGAVLSAAVCRGGGRGHHTGRCGQTGRPHTRLLHQLTWWNLLIL